jgi:hypothetical protein
MGPPPCCQRGTEAPMLGPMKPSYRIDWDGQHNRVIIEDGAGGRVDMTLEDWTRMADRIITGLFEPSNPARRKSFKKLPMLVQSFDRSSGSA